jgi:glycosyltransferase involved in cell wall biosynthesis
MKIAFVFPPIWDAQTDGSLQIWNRQVTTRLAKECDILVYSAAFGGRRRETISGVRHRRFSTSLDRFLSRGLQYLRRRLGIKRPLFSTDLWYIVYALKVALDVRRQRCDLVHVYNYPQFAHIIRRINRRLRVVLNMHGEWLAQIPFTRLNERLGQLDLLISCSDLITRSTSAGFPSIAGRCKTVPMGVSPEDFSSANDRPRQENAPLRKLLYVGRISPEKGVHDLLDAFELICRQYHDASLTIVGPEWVAPREHIANLCLEKDVIARLAPFYEGSYLSQLKARLTPEAAKRVTFVGLVDCGSVSKYYADADIYVSPALYESFGMSIIEAMAAGLPVVAARGGAVPDLISDGKTGLLVEANNPSAIAQAVGRLLTNSQLRRSIVHQTRATVCKQFSWETICSDLMQTYAEMISDTQSESLDRGECVSQNSYL